MLVGGGSDVEQAGGGVGIDFFPGVGRLVIVGVQSGKEKQDWNLFADERSVVAGVISAGGIFDFESRTRRGLFDGGLQRGACAYASYVDFLIFDAADHVHVKHGYGFVERPGWIFDPLG